MKVLYKALFHKPFSSDEIIAKLQRFLDHPEVDPGYEEVFFGKNENGYSMNANFRTEFKNRVDSISSGATWLEQRRNLLEQVIELGDMIAETRAINNSENREIYLTILQLTRGIDKENFGIHTQMRTMIASPILKGLMKAGDSLYGFDSRTYAAIGIITSLSDGRREAASMLTRLIEKLNTDVMDKVESQVGSRPTDEVATLEFLTMMPDLLPAAIASYDEYKVVEKRVHQEILRDDLNVERLRSDIDRLSDQRDDRFKEIIERSMLGGHGAAPTDAPADF